MSALLISGLIWQYQHNRLLALQLENRYQQSSLEMAHQLARLEEGLAVLKATNSPQNATIFLSQAASNVSLIRNSLSQLPFAFFPTQDVEKLLNELDLFLNTSIRQTAGGSLPLDYISIDSYHRQVRLLNNEAQKFVRMTQNNELSWRQIQQEINQGVLDDQLAASLNNLFNTAGYFVPPITPMINRPQWYESGHDIDSQEALKSLQEIMSFEFDQLVIISSDIEQSHGQYPGYDISLGTTVGNISGHVTKREGKVTWFLWDKELRETQGPRSVTYTQADRIARDFLNRIDEAIKVTEINRTASDLYYEYIFACNAEEILCYSARIWIRIAKDDGNVVGFNSTGYLFKNVDRADMLDRNLSPQQALSKVSNRLQNKTTNGPVIITLPRNIRVLAYEVAGIIDDEKYIVYINANTGEEEMILTK